MWPQCGPRKRQGTAMATIQKRTRNGKTTYRVRYRDPGGTQRSRTFDLKGVADNFARDIETKRQTGGILDPTLGAVHLNDWYTQTRGQGARGPLAPTSIAFEDVIWNHHLKPRFGGYRLTDLTRTEIQDWINDLTTTRIGKDDHQHAMSPASIRKIGGCLRRLLALAVLDDRITTNPYTKVRFPKMDDDERRFLTPGELVRLEAAFPDPHKIIVPFLAQTGLRIGELAGLQWGDIDHLRLTVRVRRNFTEEGGYGPPKTRAGRREVPTLTRDLSDRLAILRGDAPDGAQVFTSPDGGPLRPRNWRRRIFDPAVTKAKLADPQPTPHALRHTAVALWIAGGVTDHYKLIKWAGHASTAMLYRVYGHLFDVNDETAAAVRESFTALRSEAVANEARRTANGSNVVDIATAQRI